MLHNYINSEQNRAKPSQAKRNADDKNRWKKRRHTENEIRKKEEEEK